MDHSHEQRRRLQGAAQVISAGICFGSLGIFGKIAFSSGLSIGELLTFRFLLAGVFLLAALAALSPRRLRISFRQLIVCAGLGILGYAVFSSLYFISIEGVSVAMASLMLYIYPALVAVGARLFFKERLSKPQAVALACTAIGLFMLLRGEPDVRSYLAIIAGLLAAVCYALYILASSRLQASIDPLTSGSYVILFATLGLFAWHRPDLARMEAFDLRQWLTLVGIAVIGTAAPLVLFLSGLQKLGSNEASLLATIEPLTAAAAGAVLFDERPTILQALGGFLILAGLVVTTLGRSKTAIETDLPMTASATTIPERGPAPLVDTSLGSSQAPAVRVTMDRPRGSRHDSPYA